jgi:hypothetical protein
MEAGAESEIVLRDIPVDDHADLPSPEDAAVIRLVVAVHGIGSQLRYATVQSVVSRFAAYCGKQMTLPLGAFHPTKLITKPYSPELGTYLFEPPKGFDKEFGGFGFAEVFWADIPERAAKSHNTIEESKEWARTVVNRVRALDESENITRSPLIDYKKAAAVVEEMIDTIKVFETLLLITKKAGLFEFKLGQLLTDFLGDVQIVADFKDYGGDVIKRFSNTMGHLIRRMPNVKEIYIVAHSEGTVVSLIGLLTALSAKGGKTNEWVEKVKGYMTIGSPLNKHIVMWPLLWKELKPKNMDAHADPILWRNYYDYGDPVGFDLEITREWLKDNGWDVFFQFRDEDDYGFARYLFPGKAHNDYWQDRDVFGHFIKEVVLGKGKEKQPKPRSIRGTGIVGRVLPYLLCLGLVASGTYVLYKTFVTVVPPSRWGRGPNDSRWQMVGDVAGITCLLAGITVLSRMQRLEKWLRGTVIGTLAFIAGSVVYVTFVCKSTQVQISSAFRHLVLWDPDHGIIWIGLVIGVVAAIVSKYLPQWGMKPLIGLGGIAACIILWYLLPFPTPSAPERPLWPLALANAGFLYLWWLSALLFDLVYIWHRFIRSYRKTTMEILKKLR